MNLRKDSRAVVKNFTLDLTNLIRDEKRKKHHFLYGRGGSLFSYQILGSFSSELAFSLRNHTAQLISFPTQRMKDFQEKQGSRPFSPFMNFSCVIHSKNPFPALKGKKG